MRRTHAVILALTGLLSFACAKRNVIEVPPRVDLHEFTTIGIVQFESTSKGNLSAFATQRFIESLQESQPGVRVLELGKASDIEGLDSSGRIDHRAVKKIGEKYGIDALVVGDLLVKDVRPRVDILQSITTMSVSADVDAGLIARLLETEQGATVWTRSTNATRTVAQVGLNGKSVMFDAKHPESAYGELVNALVYDITYDFRPSYVRE
jgi:Mg2+ and Co2+ transporter CorA